MRTSFSQTARLSCIAILLFLFSGSSAKKVQAEHAVSTLDATFSPFTGLLVKQITDLLNTTVTPAQEKGLVEGFPSIAGIYHAGFDEFDEAGDYEAVPLFMLVSVVILLIWIFVTFLACCCRCCFRHAKGCNPVMNASPKKRRACENGCIAVYVFALACFVTTIGLFIGAVLKIPKIVNTTIENSDDILSYAKNLNSRIDLGVVRTDLGPAIVNTLYNTNFTPLAQSFGETIERLLNDAGGVLDGLSRLLELIPNLSSDVEAAITNVEDEINKGGDRDYIDLLEKLKGGLESAGTGLSSVTESLDTSAIDGSISGALSGISFDLNGHTINLSSILDASTLGSDMVDCIIDNGSAFGTCLTMELGGAINRTGLTDTMDIAVGYALDMVLKGQSLPNPIIPANIMDYVEIADTVIKGIKDGDLASALSTFITNPSTANAIGSAYPYIWVAAGFVVTLPMLVFTIPLIVSLATTGKNRKKGGKQCRGCIKCTSCGFGIGTPIIFLLVSVVGVLGALIYFILTGILLGGNISGIVDGIGGTGSIIGGEYLNVFTKGALGNGSIVSELSRITGFAPSVIQSALSIADEFFEAIQGLMSCEKIEPISNGSLNLTLTNPSLPVDDSEAIRNHGNFVSALNIGGLISGMGGLLSPDLMGSLLGSNCTDPNLANYPIDCMIAGMAGSAMGGLGSSFGSMSSALSSAKSSITNPIDALKDNGRVFYKAGSTGYFVTEAESKSLKCDNSIIGTILNAITHVSTDIDILVASKPVEADYDKFVSTCNGRVGDVVLDDYVLSKMFEEIYALGSCDVDSNTPVCGVVGSIITILDEGFKAMNLVSPIFGGSLNNTLDEVNKIIKALEDFANNVKQPSKPVKHSLSKALGTTVAALGTSISTGASNLTGFELNGLVSCYPLASVSKILFTATETTSRAWTLFTIGLLFMAIGCIIMMIASNLGPSVYHKNYSQDGKKKEAEEEDKSDVEVDDGEEDKSESSESSETSKSKSKSNSKSKNKSKSKGDKKVTNPKFVPVAVFSVANLASTKPSESNIKPTNKYIQPESPIDISQTRGQEHNHAGVMQEYNNHRSDLEVSMGGTSHISIYQTDGQDGLSVGSSAPVINGYLLEGQTDTSAVYPGIYYPSFRN